MCAKTSFSDVITVNIRKTLVKQRHVLPEKREVVYGYVIKYYIDFVRPQPLSQILAIYDSVISLCQKGQSFELYSTGFK